MKTINGVLIFWSEIKIGAGGCELFVVDLEGSGRGGAQEMDTPLTLPLAMQREEERGRGKVFNQQKAVLLM